MNYISTILTAATLTLAVSAHADEGKLCVEQACLGMTLAEAESLPLAPARYAFKFAGKDDYYGLDSSGQRVNYAETGEFDAGLMRQFRSSVATICRFGGATARLTGSDGQQVVLLFRPAIRDGKGALVLSEIGSFLPKQLSEADVQRIKTEAKSRYGDAFSANWSTAITRPDVALYQNRMVGNTLTLRLPEPDLDTALMAQPGCAGK